MTFTLKFIFPLGSLEISRHRTPR